MLGLLQYFFHIFSYCLIKMLGLLKDFFNTVRSELLGRLLKYCINTVQLQMLGLLKYFFQVPMTATYTTSRHHQQRGHNTDQQTRDCCWPWTSSATVARRQGLARAGGWSQFIQAEPPLHDCCPDKDQTRRSKVCDELYTCTLYTAGVSRDHSRY